MSNTVTGLVDVRPAGAGHRVKASFPVDLPAYAIPNRAISASGSRTPSMSK